MVDFPIRVVIDPRAARRGAQQTRRALVGIQNQADKLRKTLRDTFERRLKFAVDRAAVRNVSRQIQGVTKQADALRRVLGRVNRTRLSQLQRNLRTLQRLGRRVTGTFRRLNQVLRKLGPLGGIFAGVAAVEVSRRILRTADAFTNLQNRLRVVTDGTEDLTSATRKLFDVSQETRSSVRANAELFSRLSLATEDLGVSQERVLGFTRTLNQAILASGLTSVEARNGIIQLSQGLASGALRGDEFRSVSEQLPPVLKALQKELGVTRGELRGLAAEGKLTTEVILNAIEGSAEEIAGLFARTVPTLGQAFTVLGNSLTFAIGELDKAIGFTSTLARGMIGLAKSIDFAREGLKNFFGEEGTLSRLVQSLDLADTAVEKLKRTALSLAATQIQILQNQNKFVEGLDISIDRITTILDLLPGVGRIFSNLAEQARIFPPIPEDAFVGPPQATGVELRRQELLFEIEKSQRDSIALQSDLNELLRQGLITQEQFSARGGGFAAPGLEAPVTGFVGPRDTGDARRQREILAELEGPELARQQRIEDINVLIMEGVGNQMRLNAELERLQALGPENQANSFADALGRMNLNAEELAATFGNQLVGAIGQASNALADFVVEGANDLDSLRENLSNILKDLAKQILATIIQALILRALVGEGGTTPGAPIGGLIGLFTNPRKAGGPTTAGNFYQAGEGGPELYVSHRHPMSAALSHSRSTGYSGMRRRQGGGGVDPSEAFLVGEGGAGLFRPPNAGQIIPAAQTAALMAGEAAARGGNQPIIVPAPVVQVSIANVRDPDEIPEAIETPEVQEKIINVVRDNIDAIQRGR